MAPTAPRSVAAHGPSVAAVTLGVALALLVVRAAPPPKPPPGPGPGAGIVIVGPLGLRAPAPSR